MKKFLALMFSPQGRINRKTYILFQTYYGLALIAIVFVFFCYIFSQAGALVQTNGTIDPNALLRMISSIAPYFPALVALNFLAAWPVIAVTVKRLHDIDQSGVWVLLGFVPMIGLLLALVLMTYLCFPKGTCGENRFGESS